ncbi:hypothetical protein [Streptomyces sp. NBC_00083]|uniref:hypothetical protein n=1 Tax=Streptomyces sp. NBC_00083 TaxID=2975647 RepID=UPI002251A4B0|nr:hypothetical protein [Streptomyces sp. NBC_00083]MCX5387350.1 hypothetical protein [Streptomyces sp. NBC_00083]
MEKSWAPSNSTDPLVRAFPSRLAGDVKRVLALVPDGTCAPANPFQVEVEGETVTIPLRIDRNEPDADVVGSLSDVQQVVLHCLYSRHSDGRVRQRHLEQIVKLDEAWVVPFVVQLVGEYVVEILEAIYGGLPGLRVQDSVQRRLYGDFIVRNPAFFARTERRVVSYWSWHYRWKYQEFGTYPGSSLAEALRAAASEQAGAPWPRHTPPPSVDTGGTTA